MKEEFIPRIIHYCWFGHNPLPELAQKCIASWRQYCPDYKIVEWNEDSFDLQYCDYVAEAYECKKFAFVTDVVRLYALATYGGIYMDTDVEVIRPLDPLLEFHAISGFESEKDVPTGLMASEPNQPFILELLHEYDKMHFRLDDGSFDMTTNTTRITAVAIKYGLQLDNSYQTVNGFTFLPSEYLCPKDPTTRKLNVTDNTYCIHHFDGSWQSDARKYKTYLLENKLYKIPKTIANIIAGFLAIYKYYGLSEAIRQSLRKVCNKKIEY